MKTAKNVINENQKAIDLITKQLGKHLSKKKPEETIETPPAHEETNTTASTTEPVQEETTNTSTETTQSEETTQTENASGHNTNEPEKPVTNETPVTEEKPLSIWEQLDKPTQEDKNISTSQKETGIERMASQATSSEETSDADAQKQSNKVRAAIVVEIADVIFMFICLLLTWDFSDKNQAKFTLNSDRKKAIEHNLFKLYQVQNKKSEPKKEIMFLILGSYIPMLLVAVFGMIKRLRDKQEAKKREGEQLMNTTQPNEPSAAEIELAELKAEHLDQYNELIRLRSQQNPVNTFGKTPPLRTAKTNTSTGKRGVQAGTKRGSYNKRK